MASRRSGADRSLALLGVIDDLDAELAPVEPELRPHAGEDSHVQLLATIPGVAGLLGLQSRLRDRRYRPASRAPGSWSATVWTPD